MYDILSCHVYYILISFYLRVLPKWMISLGQVNFYVIYCKDELINYTTFHIGNFQFLVI